MSESRNEIGSEEVWQLPVHEHSRTGDAAVPVLPEVGAVVLNYMDYHATIRCVRSILSCSPLPAAIVVIDNRSPNGSLQILEKEFHGVDLVAVRDSGRNGGYSFGNNVGIRELRMRGILHAVIATSDTKVHSPNLFARVVDEIRDDIAAVGPQIRGSVRYQNPSLARLNLKYIVDLWWVQRGMPLLSLRRKLRAAYRLLRGRNDAGEAMQCKDWSEPEQKARDVYRLHGAFICLTSTYLDRFDGLDDRLFLFGEEDLLAWQCLREGMRQRLVEDVLVDHEDDSSIQMTWGEEASEFVDREQRRSGGVLRSEINLRTLVFRLWKFRR